MRDKDEELYEPLSKNDYRNLPQYQKFREKKEVSESTEFGKTYHLLKVKSNEQLAVENTVLKHKLIRAGLFFLAGLVCYFLHPILAGKFPDAWIVEWEILWLAAAVLALIGAWNLASTIFGPVTIKDVEKYKDKIDKALKDLEKHDRKRALVDSHKKRKGGRR
jgi:hypothetical protein